MHISAVEARIKFGELLSRVSLNDEEIIIERSGKSIAKLVRPNTNKSTENNQGLLLFSTARGLGHEIWAGTDATEYVAEERSEWH